MAARSRSALRNWSESRHRGDRGHSALTPRGLAEILARFYAGLLDRAVPRLRRTAVRNLSLALPDLSPEERQRIANGVFRSIARLLVGAARLPSLNKDNVSNWIEYEGFENIQRAKQRGRGVLIASGHLGNWELSGVGHALLGGETMDVVVPSSTTR